LTSESLNDRADRARLATATLLMAMGLDDIDIAMETAKNAVENNFVPQLMRALSVLSKIGTKVGKVSKKGITKNVKKTVEKVEKVGEKVGKTTEKGVKKKGELTIRPGQEWKQKIEGTGQVTGPGHSFKSTKIGIREAKKSDTEKVLLDLGINRVTKNPIKPNRRPDVTVLKKDGRINQIEVKSKTDNRNNLLKRMNDTRNQLPEHQRGTTKVVEIIKEKK
jgi:hypothetical protein